jgi:two-component system cell cycle sensor histidine kinase/response regulator CckA
MMPTALRLLVLEDDPFDVELEVATLEKAGYVCQWERVETRVEFLACLDAPNYDVILADYNLPTFDGLTALQLFLERGLDLPFILVSGTLGEETAIESLKAGATDYVLKDHLERLGPVVSRALREHEERRQRQQAEEALQKNRQLLNAIIDNSPVAIQVKDLQGRYLLINHQIEELLNSHREEIIGRTPDEFLPPDVATKFLADDQDVLKAGTAVQSEDMLSLSDGIHTFVVIKFPLLDAAGVPYAVAGISTDITERKRVEEAFRESEHMLTEAQKVAHVGCWEWNVHSDVIQWSEEERRIFGLDPQGPDLTLDQVLEFVHPDDVESARENIRKDLAGEAPYKFETRIVWPDGSVRYIDTRAEVYRDDQGEPVRVLGTTMDITERRRAEDERERLLAQIQEQAQRVQQIMDAVPEGVIFLDTGNCVVLANPLGQAYLTTLTDVKVGDTLIYLGDRTLAELLTSPPQGLWHEITAEGRVFQTIARSIETDPTPGGWVLVVREVTQQREIERRVQQQEQLAVVGQLAAGIAHDFNNIMAAIVLYAQMTARTQGLPARIQEWMGTINQQAQHATHLIQQILDFSRHAVLKRQPLNLLPLLKEQVRLLERTLPESIGIELAYGPGEYTINADPTRVQQMIMNLAVNARDAMPNGGKLRIKLERMEVKPSKSPVLPAMEAGEWMRVTVSDTGTGITPDVLPHIFDPFFTTKAPGEGSGLGLAQVYGIVGQHGGRIGVETQVGKGTAFTIYLPALPVHPVEMPALESSSPALGQGETVLVVEDEMVVREALKESLKSLNYQVLEAANAKEALAILEAHDDEVVLVLSDVVMPEMGGIALFHALRREGLTVPMVLLTGHPMEKELNDLTAQGLRAWLPKPPSLEQLAQAITKALSE